MFLEVFQRHPEFFQKLPEVCQRHPEFFQMFLETFGKIAETL
jgi:hypothetical protein